MKTAVKAQVLSKRSGQHLSGPHRSKFSAWRDETQRRQIDPTTCEREYSDDEVEFMNAIDQYKRTNGRPFPTCSEILEVIRSLGYAKKSALL